MNKEVRIETLPFKKLVGYSLEMSLSRDKTLELWQKFMPRRKAIANTIGTDLYCATNYQPALDIENFNANTIFTKWAAIEISAMAEIPEGMQVLNLNKGLYAVFIHKGLTKDFTSLLAYIFEKWLPASDYRLDHRPHFEILGDKYKNNHPDSEEEVWIPIRPKK
jgi:AraC family transcriptional regulator